MIKFDFDKTIHFYSSKKKMLSMSIVLCHVSKCELFVIQETAGAET